MTFTFATWTRSLTARGFAVLSPSHAVPVSLWLGAGDRVLHFSARGTRLRLTAYDRSDLTHLLLRSECDCEEHRLAGAAGRMVINPGAKQTAEVVFDGAATLGWTGHQAAVLPLAEAAGILEALLQQLPDQLAIPVAS